MTMIPDALSYILDFFHALACYLVLGPEEDTATPLLLFPKSAKLDQPYRILTSILKSLS